MARSTRAAAATAARAERRRLASSKLASRLAVERPSRRRRLSSHSNRICWAPIRVSRAPMASPSRTTTRSVPRVSFVFADTPRRRAAPTSASAASWQGHATSRAEERPGSVNEPCARKAPRHAASLSATVPAITCGGNPTTGCPDRVTRPSRRARSCVPSVTRRRCRELFDTPPGLIVCSCTSTPYISRREAASRRATAAESSSASSTSRPATICSCPENRSSAAVSAARADCRETTTRASSSLTLAVNATAATAFPSRVLDPGQSSRTPSPPGRCGGGT